MLLPKVKIWIPFGQLLLILLIWSSLLAPTVKGDFFCSPDDGEPTFEGIKEVFKFSGTTDPVSPSTTAPDSKELVSPSVKTFVARSKLHFYISTDTTKVSTLNPETSKSGFQLPELRSLILIWQELLILFLRSFILTSTEKRDHNFSPDTEESSLLSQLSTFLQLDTEMSSLLYHSTRYLTLFSGTIVLPVIAWCLQSQSQAERLYPWQYLQLLRQSQSKGQYLCNGHTTPYTNIPSLMLSVTVSSLPAEYSRLLRQSLSNGQYLCESTLHLTQSSLSLTRAVPESRKSSRETSCNTCRPGTRTVNVDNYNLVLNMSYFVREKATWLF